MIDMFQQVVAPQRQAPLDLTLLPAESISKRRQMAEALLKSATDTSPVQHWTQAAARAMGGLTGALGAYTADRMGLQKAEAEAAKAASAKAKSEAEQAQANELLMGLYPGSGAAPQDAAPAPEAFAQDRTAMARAMLQGSDPAAAAPAVMSSMQPPPQAPQPQASPQMQGMPSYNQLKAMLANPNTRAMGIEFLKEIQQRAMGPDAMGQLDMEYKRAQIAKMQREAASGPGETGEYALVPQYAQDADGNFVPWVPGKGGTPKVITLPDNLKALAPADTSYQRAKGKELGEAAGTAQADLRRIEDNAGLALATVQKIRAHPGKGSALGWSAPMGHVPGTSARGFANLVDQAAGQTFLEAFNSLRGGGQITEAEGRKATQALARLDRYQSQEDFDAALNDLEEVITVGMQRARQKAGGFSTSQPGGASGGGAAADPLGIR